MAYRGYKYRLYPNDEARAFFARCFGATRYCYNYCVREYDAALKEGRELSGFDIAARLREHTKDLKWMAGVDYYVKEFAPKRFDNALMKYKRHEANRPREHKKGERPSVSYTTSGDTIKVDFKHDLVQLPKIGLVRARLHRSFDGEITSATIKREADGKYYISLTVSSEDVAAPMKPHSEAGTVGVDVGLRHLATLSDGTSIDLPDTRRSLARIDFLKKRLSFAQPGSKRYYRTKLQIARLHHHLANVTKDAHHKAAARLCRDYDTICMETLNVKGMRQGKGSNKTAAEVAFNAELHRSALALFHDRVERKAADTGTNFVKIDRWEPSTKRCHRCGYVLDSIDLDTKEWTCPECGTRHDRDVNAAINIRNLGIEKLQERSTTRTLPPAEGNVKPAKKTTAGYDLRTGKRTVRINRPPKAQIAIGSAPPRIFYNIHRLEPDHPFRYFNMCALGRIAGLPNHTVAKYIDEGRFIEPTPENTEVNIKLLKGIKSASASLRKIRLSECEIGDVPEKLVEINKVLRISSALRERFRFQCPFAQWKNQCFPKFMIDEMNEIVTAGFLNKIDTIAYEYLKPLLPQEPLKAIQPTRLLRREMKDDSLIEPSDDPNILSYEDRLLPIIRPWFFYRSCHVIQDTFEKIVGKGTFFRPHNCTKTRMSTFVNALYQVAETLSEIDTTVEGTRARMDQFYYINEKYVNLTEIVRRNFCFDKPTAVYYFKRAGKYTPEYYNKHYHEIMLIITHDIPALIRESAICLSVVYQL